MRDFVNKKDKDASKETIEELSHEHKQDSSSNKSEHKLKAAPLMFVGVALTSLSNHGASAIINTENPNNVSFVEKANNNHFFENSVIKSGSYIAYLSTENSSDIECKFNSKDNIHKNDNTTIVEATQKIADLTTDVFEAGFDPIAIKHDKERRTEAEESKRKQEDHERKKQSLKQNNERMRQQEEFMRIRYNCTSKKNKF